MAERIKQQTQNINSETNFPVILDQISRLDALINIDSIGDDLISSLQSRRENRRARQVFEWELTRRDSAPLSKLPGII